jgi:hypothetical protein
MPGYGALGLVLHRLPACRELPLLISMPERDGKSEE